MKVCPKCKDHHNKNGKFCSRTCANSRGPRSEDFKQKVRAKLIGRISPLKGRELVSRIEKSCYYCDTPIQLLPWQLTDGANYICQSKYCRNKQHIDAGKKSALSRKLRSKDEISLCQLCESFFQNVSHNKPIANGWDADILLEDHQIAILWNGPWHYKEMSFEKHSLKQVQNRDKIKIKEFENIGWTVLVYEDRYYTPETAFEDIKEMVVRVGLEPT